MTVDFVPSGSSVVSMARVGRPSILHATAVGKIVLAFGGLADPVAAAQPLAAHTERTITNADALAAELESIRERGYAESIGEREPDLGAIAAPVFGRGHELTAILGIQGPASRLPPATRKTLRAPLLAAAAQLGGLLGGA